MAQIPRMCRASPARRQRGDQCLRRACRQLAPEPNSRYRRCPPPAWLSYSSRPVQTSAQLLLVIHLLRDVGGDDDLRFSIHGDLRVVGLHEAAFVCSISHDSAIRIGEVALRGIFRLRLLGVGNLWWTPAYL